MIKVPYQKTDILNRVKDLDNNNPELDHPHVSYVFPRRKYV